jgi:hypothetical protein
VGKADKRLANLKPPFAPGHEPTPGAGRRPGTRNWAVVFRERFERGEITQDELADVLIKEAKGGNVNALEKIMDRTDGRPIQPIAMQGELKTIAETDEATLNVELERIKAQIANLGGGDNPGKD